MDYDIRSKWMDGVPFCTDVCPQYDGKRCEILGARPCRVCEPSVARMSSKLTDCAVALQALQSELERP
jgi:hypothetical protein